MKKFINFFEKNNKVKILICVITYLLLTICYNYTHSDIFLWLYIIPSLYMIPMVIIMFAYAWIINPIKDLKK